jgi:two-component system cell cycle sensor histidine kinase/response regulator CckA
LQQARAQGHSEATEVVFTIARAAASRATCTLPASKTRRATARAAAVFVRRDRPGPAAGRAPRAAASAQALQQRNEQLHASEKRLEAVINSALDAIICVDQHQRITVFNPTAAALFQCSASDALGSPLERFLPDAAQALAFAQLTTQAMLGEMTACTASGKELAVEVSVSFERHAEGETTTVFARDLTGRKKAEAHRNELEAQLRESHKMQAVGTMAGGIAHDFNNILGAILGNVELAKADCAPGSAGAGEPARNRQGRPPRTRSGAPDPHLQPQRAATAHRRVAGRSGARHRAPAARDPAPAIELHMQLQPGLPPVLADATQVEQALLNLCTNAVHAIGRAARGSILVEAALVHPDQRLCERLGLAPGDYVALTVHDNGPGMDAATLERIFEPFFTTKPVGQGTGLGLAVVHGVMRTHEGGIDVHSAPGQGSRFTLYFPVATAQAASSAAVAALPTAPALHPRPPTAGAKSPCHVRGRRPGAGLSGAAPAAPPGLRGERLHRPPRGHGRAARRTAPLRPAGDRLQHARFLRRGPGARGAPIRPDLPVALASGYVTAEIEQAAMAEGARALIHKPNDVEELCATVERLIMPGMTLLADGRHCLHEDADLLVLAKPAGLLCVPGRGPTSKTA